VRLGDAAYQAWGREHNRGLAPRRGAQEAAVVSLARQYAGASAGASSATAAMVQRGPRRLRSWLRRKRQRCSRKAKPGINEGRPEECVAPLETCVYTGGDAQGQQGMVPEQMAAGRRDRHSGLGRARS